MSFVAEFISTVRKIHATGSATEHSYRSALEALFTAPGDGVAALNEPRRIKCGAPDFLVSKGDIAIGHVEAKDLHIGLRAMKDANKAQQDRYRAALPNLIYTNCLDWDFYRDGGLVASVTIADLATDIRPRPDRYQTLENLLRDFIARRPQTIASPRELAERMAGKAILIKDVLGRTLADDENLQSELAAQFHAFRENLIHDITAEDFADIYAETVAYGMFAARLHDRTRDTFSRREALELLPKSNPFLRSLFTYVAGYDLDDRIAWIIDDLARVFRACDVAGLMDGFGGLTGQNDPFLHFYETFLAAYNPAKRKARGVWYTPEPVVNFIVRAVDEVLRTEFGLAEGLADTSKVAIDLDTGRTDNKGKPVTIKKDVHRVQILDPATGTGTFLAEAIKRIAPKVKDIAPGMWSQYIEQDLIPRLHGFEILMASYAMCHMKLDMILTEMGYKPTGSPPRLSVYLTNSLEEGEQANQTTLPFAKWLSREAKGANTVKRDTPIMCVIGNPPYSGISQNMGKWITGLIEDYKYVDGKHFGERKHWLHDDYVKFIRLSESLIEKNGEGVLGFITNHGYLDNPTFRGMRWRLLDTFDRIWVLDLHGNAKKKEVTPEGRPDKNVFDIQQGVAIIVAVKKQNTREGLGRVFRMDYWGSRENKYQRLDKDVLGGEILEPFSPYYFFSKMNKKAYQNYENGFPVNGFFENFSSGFVSARDELNIQFRAEEIKEALDLLLTGSETDVRQTFNVPKDSRDWSVRTARADAQDVAIKPPIMECAYRPFDTRWTCYTGKSRGLYSSPQQRIQSSLFETNENFALNCSKTSGEANRTNVFATDKITDFHIVGGSVNVLPLYLYPDEHDKTRRVNFDPKLYNRLRKMAAHPTHGAPDEVQTFDYIYGVLHCPAYRETYAEFLKIDFPRIPWPSGPDEFRDVSAKGGQLRRLHLMDPAAVGATPYPFMGDGDNAVGKPAFKDGRVWINKTQYFDAAPEISWDFYIGGYRPAQKWLKDRKGRVLDFEDVKHYRRILKILSETDRIMKTITTTLDSAESDV